MCLTCVANTPPAQVERQYGDGLVSQPHVVILGAGASRAALPDGDVSGLELPLMADFLDVLPAVREPIEGIGIEIDEKDFELTYSRIAASGEHPAVVEIIETEIYRYFDSLRLPPTPTLYDYLLLALRGKDVIATFNWDPLLLQAAQRCRVPDVESPRLLFLHGNVLSGFCTAHSVSGYRGNYCSTCGREFRPSRLLYPKDDKNYSLDPQIRGAWDYLKRSLKNAFMVTIFGYSAPISDKSAVDALKAAWGENAFEEMNQVEIIDIREEGELRAAWHDFIHFDHYEVHAGFHDSWIAKHPRRTGEAHRQQYWEAEWLVDNCAPQDINLGGLIDWHRTLMEMEEDGVKPWRSTCSRDVINCQRIARWIGDVVSRTIRWGRS